MQDFCHLQGLQIYYFFLTYANYFCILHEISMKLQKKNEENRHFMPG